MSRLHLFVLGMASLLLALTGCGGSGGDSGTPTSRNTGFVFFSRDLVNQTSTLFAATVDDPEHPWVLHSFNDTTPGEAAIDPASKRVFFQLTSKPKEIRVVNWDGTGDQSFLTSTVDLGLIGFLPDGKLTYLEGGVQKKLDVQTKAVSDVAMVNGHYLQDYRYWNPGRTAFLWQDFAAPAVMLQPVGGGTSTMIANDAHLGQFFPDGTIGAVAFVSGPDAFGVYRYQADGTRLPHPVVSPMNSNNIFLLAGDSDVLGNEIIPAIHNTPQVTLYHAGDPTPVLMTPATVNNQNALLDAVDFTE